MYLEYSLKFVFYLIYYFLSIYSLVSNIYKKSQF